MLNFDTFDTNTFTTDTFTTKMKEGLRRDHIEFYIRFIKSKVVPLLISFRPYRLHPNYSTVSLIPGGYLY